MPSQWAWATSVLTDGDADVVVLWVRGVAAALEVDLELRGSGGERGDGEGVVDPGAAEESAPDPGVPGFEEAGEVVGVLLEAAGGDEGGHRLGGERRAATGGGADGHAHPTGGDGELVDGVLGVGGVCALGEEEEGGPGDEAVGAGLDVEGDGDTQPRQAHRRGVEHESGGGKVGGGSGESRGGGEEVLPGDGVEALGAGGEACEESLGLAGRATPQADGAAGGADAGLSGDDAVEDDGDEEPCGRGRGVRGRRRGGGERARRRPSWCRPGRRSGGRGPGRGGRGRGERSGGDRAEGGPVRAVAHRDGLGGSGAGGEEAVHAQQVVGSNGSDAGAEADDGVGPGAAGGESREAGLGEVEEAGDEEPLRAVLLGEGVEAARAQLEGDARARALDDAERDVGRVAVRGPSGSGRRSGSSRLPPPGAPPPLSPGGAAPGERRRRDGPVRRHSAANGQVLEPVEYVAPLRRPESRKL